MLKVNEVLKNVLKKIKPSAEERKLMKELTRRVLKVSEKILAVYGAKPMLCGSVAKNTWIKPELDLFMLFNPLLSREKLEEYGMRAAKDIISALNGRYRITYTEHPYITGVIKFKDKNYAIDVVPCYDVPPERIKSAVDRTPHHVRFVLKKLPGLEDEVRLLKKFCMARECYGADLKNRGFSGYLCELLIIKYGKFVEVLRNAVRWKPGIMLTLNGKPAKKFKDPLVFVDPVDPKRNVAAAVSVETFLRFIKSCKEFLENPSEKFFERDEIKPYSIIEIVKEMKIRGTRWYMIRFEKPEIQEDILYSQMRRFIRRISDIIEDGGFKILRSDFWCGYTDCIVILEMEVWQLPKIKKHIGPSVFSKHSKEFLKHYKNYNVFIENGKWVVEYERKHSFLLEFLKEFFSLSERGLKEKGVPSKIAESIHRRCEIASGFDVIRTIRKLPDEFRVFLRKYFERDLNIGD